MNPRPIIISEKHFSIFSDFVYFCVWVSEFSIEFHKNSTLTPLSWWVNSSNSYFYLDILGVKTLLMIICEGYNSVWARITFTDTKEAKVNGMQSVDSVSRTSVNTTCIYHSTKHSLWHLCAPGIEAGKSVGIPGTVPVFTLVWKLVTGQYCPCFFRVFISEHKTYW